MTRAWAGVCGVALWLCVAAAVLFIAAQPTHDDSVLFIRDGPAGVFTVPDGGFFTVTGTRPVDKEGCVYQDGWHPDDEVACFRLDNAASSNITLSEESRAILTVPDVAPECSIDVLIQFQDGTACYAGLKTGRCVNSSFADARPCRRHDWLRWRKERAKESSEPEAAKRPK